MVLGVVLESVSLQLQLKDYLILISKALYKENENKKVEVKSHDTA